MKTRKFIERLKRYLTGTSDESEKKLVDEWYNSFPVHTDIEPLHKKDKEAYLFKRITDGITYRQNKRSVFKLNQFWKAAAVLFLISAVTFLYWKQQHDRQNYNARFVVISTGNKGLKKITLPDSSTVWLNTSGKLRFQRAFTDSSRVVYLDEGEAFFEVTKNPEKPFYVYTPSLHTRVLGTSFNVKSYQSLNFVRITVATGKVQIADSLKSYGLFTAGQQLTYNLLNGNTIRQQLQDSEPASWRTGKVQLYQASFNELSLAINSLYGIPLKAADPSINKLKYTLTLESNRPLTEALMIINAIHETKTRRTTHEITLYK